MTVSLTGFGVSIGEAVESLNGETGPITLTSTGSTITITATTPSTINLESSGSGGTPGGSNTQVQYNNSSTFGGITGATSDGTNLLVTTQAASDNSTKAASTAYTTTAIANAIAGVNPAVAVQAATIQASDTSGLTYNNGASGIGATFTGTVNTALTIDGYTFTAPGQRLLVKNDTQSANSGAYNGVYYVTQLQTALLAPVLTRALDYDQPSDINNTGAIPVISGTVNALTSWLLTSQVVTIGTSVLTYAQFSYSTAVTSFSGDGTLISNSGSTGAVTATLQNAAANSVWGNNTSGSAAPGYQNSINISGTIASGSTTVTSTSAVALVVGQNGPTNPAFQVNTSAPSSKNGLEIISSNAGSTVQLNVISSAAFEGLTIATLGTGGGALTLNGANTTFALGFNLGVSVTSDAYLTRSAGAAGSLLEVSYNTAGASTGYQNNLTLGSAVNQSSTAGFRGLWITPYLQGTGSSTTYLIDAGTNTAVGGTGTHSSRFSVDNNGNTICNRIVVNGTSISADIATGTNNFNTSANYTVGGFGVQISAKSYNSTTATGTIAKTGVVTLGTPTLTATNTTTITNASTLYIAAAPSAGNGMTLTNAWGMYIDGNAGAYISGGQTVIASSNATAFAVGQNGATNPALQINTATASSVTGIAITSAASGGGVLLQATSTATNENLNLGSHGGGSINLEVNSGVKFSVTNNAFVCTPGSSSTPIATAKFAFTGAADTGMTSGAEANSVYFNSGQLRTWAGNTNVPVQRDFRITGTIHAFASTSGTMTTTAVLGIDGLGQAGVNNTVTNGIGIYIPTQSAAGTGVVTNAYAGYFVAPTGASTINAAFYTSDGTNSARFADGTYAINIISGSLNASTTLVTSLSVNGTLETFPGSGILVGTTDTQTLTNKRITKRVLALSAGSATPAINTDSYDVVHITNQGTAAITSFTTSLTGTPVDGDQLRISITGNATSLTWGTSFESSTVSLPTTTVSTNRLDVGLFYNTETSKWRCVASA